MTRTITVAHSPDSDDAFMFYALAKQRIDTGDLVFKHVLSDIETLNRRALEETYDITAISFHAYPAVAKGYAVLTAGASIGEGYGPMVLARRPRDLASLRGARIAIPGTLTTAYLTLRLALDEFEAVVMDFDRIIEAVEQEEVDAGLIIHEGQVLYPERGLSLVLDLGAWWEEDTGLPLPLGCNAVRRSLGPELMQRVGRAVRASIDHALEHRAKALDHALSYARGMDPAKADAFVGMYVNEETRSMSEDTRKAAQLLLERGWRAGLIPVEATIDFVDCDPE